MQFIYFSPWLCMFKYKCWEIMIFHFNKKMSRIFTPLVNSYTFFLFMISRWLQSFSEFIILWVEPTRFVYFLYVFLYLVIYNSVQMDFLILILFYKRRNSLLFPWYLELTKEDIYTPWWLSSHWWVLRRLNI